MALQGRLTAPGPFDTPKRTNQHLGRLRLAGLVQVRRDGRRMLYRVASDHVHALVAEAYEFASHVARSIPHHVAD